MRLLSRVLDLLLRVPLVWHLASLLTSMRFVVEGDSMEPAFAQGQRLLVNRLAYRLATPRRGEVVVLRDPREPSRRILKRIVGLPGESLRLESGRLLVNGQPVGEPYLAGAGCWGEAGGLEWQLGDEEYFVMGDRRSHSTDSRTFGPVPRSLIVGRPWFRYWPPEATGYLVRRPRR